MISIFNSRGITEHKIYVNIDVALRNYLHLFHNGHNSNALATFLCMALHVNSDGWCYPSRDTIARETALGDRAIRNALAHLRQMRIKDKRVLAHYRKISKGKWGGSIYLLFPETPHGNPPDGWEHIAEYVGTNSPPTTFDEHETVSTLLYPVGRWQVTLFRSLRSAYAAKSRRGPEKFQTEEQRVQYQEISDVLGEEDALDKLKYALGVKGMLSLSQIVAYLRGCANLNKKKGERARPMPMPIELI